jgi:signal transduction histidine kinase
MFSVKDTGVGIKEEAQSKIFEPFTQADNSITRRFVSIFILTSLIYLGRKWIRIGVSTLL